jgi:Rne/Rng family ribonuclease
MTKKILINYAPWQTRIAIIVDGKLQNIYFDSHTSNSIERSFFKGVVMKILPGIQTTFVNIGQERAGFLHISEIDRDLALKKMARTIDAGDDDFDEEGDFEPREKKERSSHRTQADIRKIFKEKEVILVQAQKEPVGTKGAKLSTCFTLPGRFIVLMPNIQRIGISKKIDDLEERKRLKALVKAQLPEQMGAIIRTTSSGRGEREIIQDVQYLVNTWDIIQKRFKEAKPGEKIYQDIDLCPQIVRDHLDNSVESSVCV